MCPLFKQIPLSHPKIPVITVKKKRKKVPILKTEESKRIEMRLKQLQKCSSKTKK